MIRIFAALLPVAGCTERGLDESGIDEREFDLQLCSDAGLDLLGGIAPAQSVEYSELRDAWIYDPDMAESVVVKDAAGEICGAAADAEACMAAFAGLPLESSMRYQGADAGEQHRTLAITRGDEALAITSATAVLEFLGPIDTPQDAGLFALAQFHQLVCDGRNDAAEVDDGFLLFTRSGGGCGEGDDKYEHVVHVAEDGAIEELETVLVERGDPSCAVGRLPAGLCRGARASRRNDVGRFFAEVAELEAAAVHAFGQLARELAVHGAPRSLVAAALRSRRDEIRHARTTAALARRFGARPIAPRVREVAPRSLVDVAADNAAEGCVRETFGALVATQQSRRATDPVVRRAMRSIAVDETRHAALSWDLAAWANTRLRPADRRRVTAHARRAGEAFERDAIQEHPDAVHRVAGMPRPDEARTLFRQLQRSMG